MAVFSAYPRTIESTNKHNFCDLHMLQCCRQQVIDPRIQLTFFWWATINNVNKWWFSKNSIFVHPIQLIPVLTHGISDPLFCHWTVSSCVLSFFLGMINSWSRYVFWWWSMWVNEVAGSSYWQVINTERNLSRRAINSDLWRFS